MKVEATDPLGRLKGLLDRIQQQDQASTSRESGKTASTEGAAGSKDQMVVSSRAQELAALREAVESSPEVRQELVQQLRDEISSGRYRIDGTRIADAMLRESDQS